MIEDTFCVYTVSALCFKSFVLSVSCDAFSTIKSKKSRTFVITRTKLKITKKSINFKKNYGYDVNGHSFQIKLFVAFSFRAVNMNNKSI